MTCYSSLIFLEHRKCTIKQTTFRILDPTKKWIQLYRISGIIHFNFGARIKVKIRYYLTRHCTIILACDFWIDWVWYIFSRPFLIYRHGMCFRMSYVFVSSILIWFPQCTHCFLRVFRFLFLERKPNSHVTSVKNVQGCF